MANWDFNVGGSATGQLGINPDLTQRPQKQSEVIITNFASGHGFAHGGTGTQIDDSTTIAIRGSQSVKQTTDGAGGLSSTSKTAMTAVDFTGKRVVFWIMADNWTRINTLTFYATSDTFTNYSTWGGLSFANRTTDQMPNPMEWIGVSLSPLDAAIGGGTGCAFNAVTGWKIAVADTGGIDSLGAINFWVGGITNIPAPANGVVSLSFDDAWLTQYTNAMPKMAQYGYRGTCYVIRDLIDNQNPQYQSLQQLQYLQDPLGWEIGSHANTVANHSALPRGFASLDSGTVDGEMNGIKTWLVNKGFRGGDHFAWPGGHWNDGVAPNPGTNLLSGLAQKYFISGRGLQYGSPEDHRWPSAITRMRARLVDQSDSAATLNGLIDTAMANKEWIILVFHQITPSTTIATQYSVANFGTVIDHINSTSATCLPVGEAIRFAT